MNTHKCVKNKSALKLLDCFVRLDRLNMDELAKKSTPIVAVRTQKPVQIKESIDHQRLANKYWTAAKKQSKSSAVPLKVGQVVLARMRTYRPWPAKILNDEKKTVFWVRFYGKETEGSVPKIECVLFQDALECVQEYLKIPVDDYGRAVREAEINLGIPYHASLLRN